MIRIFASLLILAILTPVRGENHPVPSALPKDPGPTIVNTEKVPAKPPAALSGKPEKTTDKAGPESIVDQKNKAETKSNEDNKSTVPKDPKTDPKAAKKGKGFGPGVTNVEKEEWGQPDIKISMWKYIASMILILGLIFAFFFGLRRISAKLGGSGYGSLNVSQRLQLDSKNSLVLIRFHEEELLIATGPNGSNLISRTASLEEQDLGDGEDTADGLETKQVPDNNSQPFLAKFLGGRINSKDSQ